MLYSCTLVATVVVDGLIIFRYLILANQILAGNNYNKILFQYSTSRDLRWEVVPGSLAGVVDSDGSRTGKDQVLGDFNAKTSHSRHENVSQAQLPHCIVTQHVPELKSSSTHLSPGLLNIWVWTCYVQTTLIVNMLTKLRVTAHTCNEIAFSTRQKTNFYKLWISIFFINSTRLPHLRSRDHLFPLYRGYCVPTTTPHVG